MDLPPLLSAAGWLARCLHCSRSGPSELSWPRLADRARLQARAIASASVLALARKTPSSAGMSACRPTEERARARPALRVRGRQGDTLHFHYYEAITYARVVVFGPANFAGDSIICRSLGRQFNLASLGRFLFAPDLFPAPTGLLT